MNRACFSLEVDLNSFLMFEKEILLVSPPSFANVQICSNFNSQVLQLNENSKKAITKWITGIKIRI